VDTLSVFNLVVLPHVVAGTPAAYPGDLDVEHSWTYIEDAARTMIAAARQDATWGRVWHVPSTSTLPVRALTERLAAVAGAPRPQLTELSLEELVRLGEQDSIMAELVEIQYLDREPHVLDSAHTEAVLGVSATPVDSVLEETVREQLRVG
jgi:nucleoside-diphosphate-sugar epimerase